MSGLRGPGGAELQDASLFCGVFRLGGADVAIPLTAMREVVSRPSEFVALPVAAPDLLGAIDLRGLVVPVFDLRRHLGLEPITGSQDAIVVISDGTRILGILADELSGVAKISTDAMLPVSGNSSQVLLSHTFQHPDTAVIISMVDILRVLDMPEFFSVIDTRSENAPSRAGSLVRGKSAQAGGRSVTVTVLQCGDFTLALDVAGVHTTLPDSSARPSILSSPLCRGVTAFGADDIAVVDPLSLLELGALPTDHNGPGVVLEVGGKFVMLAVTGLISIQSVPRAAILPVPRLALGRSELVSGVCRMEGFGDVLVLDRWALAADRELLALGSLNVASEDGTALGRATSKQASVDEQTVVLSGAAQLTYSIGCRVATPLGQVSEIIKRPEVLVVTDGPAYLMGIMTYRDAIVSIICLATALGRSAGAISGTTCVLLTDSEHGRVGFVVEALIGIDPLAWRDERASSRTEAEIDPADALAQSPLVKLGTDPRLIPNLDLVQLANALLRPAPSAQSWDFQLSSEVEAA